MSLDSRTLLWAQEFVKRYWIKLHDPVIDADLKALIANSPRPHDERLLRSIVERLLLFQRFHENYPFAVVPKNTLSGEYILGYQVANNMPILFCDRDLLRHAGIFGGTGTGKTTLIYNLVYQVLEHGHKVFFFDPKDDSLNLAVHNPNFLILSSNGKFNILQKPVCLTLEEFINLITTIWGRCIFSGENQKNVFFEALVKAYAEYDPPSLADVKRIVDSMQSPRDTFQRRDAAAGISNRLQRFSTLFPQPFNTHKGITYETLYQHPLYMNALFHDEYTTFLYTLFVYILYLNNRKNNIRDKLDYLLVNDEGNRFWSMHQVNIEETPTLVDLQGVIREFGMALIHSSVNEESLHPILKSNTYINVAMNLTSGSEEREASKNFNFTQDQREYLAKNLRRGQAIARFGDAWREPILLYFPYRNIIKAVSRDERTEAEQRISRYAPPDLPEIVSDPLPTTKHQEEPPKAPAPETPEPIQPNPPPTKPLSRSEPKAPPAIEPVNPLQMNESEEKLLEYVCHHFAPTSSAFKSLGLHPMTGTAAKKKLIALGFIEEQSVIVRAGRGGRAKILLPSESAFQRLGLKPNKGTRGGDGPQHRYLCRAMADLIPEAKLELLIGTKSVDVFFTYKEALHRPLFDELRIIVNMEKKSQANDPFQQAKEGAAIGTEIEISSIAKTGQANARQDISAGLSLALIAVMPDQLAKAETLLMGYPNTIVIDALKLLDILRKLYDQGKAS